MPTLPLFFSDYDNAKSFDKYQSYLIKKRCKNRGRKRNSRESRANRTSTKDVKSECYRQQTQELCRFILQHRVVQTDIMPSFDDNQNSTFTAIEPWHCDHCTFCNTRCHLHCEICNRQRTPTNVHSRDRRPKPLLSQFMNQKIRRHVASEDSIKDKDYMATDDVILAAVIESSLQSAQTTPGVVATATAKTFHSCTDRRSIPKRRKSQKQKQRQQTTSTLWCSMQEIAWPAIKNHNLRKLRRLQRQRLQAQNQRKMIDWNMVLKQNSWMRTFLAGLEQPLVQYRKSSAYVFRVDVRLAFTFSSSWQQRKHSPTKLFDNNQSNQGLIEEQMAVNQERSEFCQLMRDKMKELRRERRNTLRLPVSNLEERRNQLRREFEESQTYFELKSKFDGVDISCRHTCWSHTKDPRIANFAVSGRTLMEKTNVCSAIREKDSSSLFAIAQKLWRTWMQERGLNVMSDRFVKEPREPMICWEPRINYDFNYNLQSLFIHLLPLDVISVLCLYTGYFQRNEIIMHGSTFVNATQEQRLIQKSTNSGSSGDDSCFMDETFDDDSFIIVNVGDNFRSMRDYHRDLRDDHTQYYQLFNFSSDDSYTETSEPDPVLFDFSDDDSW